MFAFYGLLQERGQDVRRPLFCKGYEPNVRRRKKRRRKCGGGGRSYSLSLEGGGGGCDILEVPHRRVAPS